MSKPFLMLTGDELARLQSKLASRRRSPLYDETITVKLWQVEALAQEVRAGRAAKEVTRTLQMLSGKELLNVERRLARRSSLSHDEEITLKLWQVEALVKEAWALRRRRRVRMHKRPTLRSYARNVQRLR